MTTNRQPSPAPTSRSRVLTVLLVLAVVTTAVAGGLAALGAVALLVAVPWVFLGAGVLSFLALDLAGAAWVARRRATPGQRCRARRALFASSATLLLAAFAVTTLVPPAGVVPARAALPGEREVAVATGSRLAVVRLQARGPARQPPIVVLHGGPGIPDLAANVRAFAPLTGLGADVYLYAQLGTDASTRLADPRRLGRDRDVADLEALRARLGLDRMTLLGHSYGGALAAAYLAAHPERVSRLVLVSPGALDPADTSGDRATARLDTASECVCTWRCWSRGRCWATGSSSSIRPQPTPSSTTRRPTTATTRSSPSARPGCTARAPRPIRRPGARASTPCSTHSRPRRHRLGIRARR